MLITLLTLLISPAFAQTDIDVEALSQRFVSTVVESRITRQFAEVPQIADCLQDDTNVVSEDDLKTGDKDAVRNKIRTAQKNASDCIKKKLENVQGEELEKVSKELGLKEYGLVKGQGTKAIVDYFSKRFEKVFFTTKNGKTDRMIVDQTLFFDIYESQIGKSVLLEISNYCMNQLDLTQSTNRAGFYNALQATPPDISKFTDTFEKNRPATNSVDPSPDAIYDEFLTDVVGQAPGSTLDPTSTKNRLESVYKNCTQIIPNLCKVYQECLCDFNKQVETAKGKAPPSCNGLPSGTDYQTQCVSGTTTSITAGSTQIVEPTRGRNSCHVEARLRAHRTNLNLVNEQQTLLRNEYGGGAQLNAATSGNDVYQGGDQSIDDLTSLSSKDIDEIQMGDEKSEECKLDDCSQFSFDASESSKFANTAAAYSAVTAIELKKLKDSQNDDEKLIGFLKSKGYNDLADEVSNKSRGTDLIVQDALQRFESHREATFGEMAKAFERKQLVGDEQTRTQKIDDIKSDLKNRSNDFKQLVLFNNVVMSFLNIQRRKSDGSLEDAGTNVKSLQRETSSNSVLGNSLGSLSSGSGQIGNNEAPIVDQEFINSVLGEPTLE
jgi:hypothetical protein